MNIQLPLFDPPSVWTPPKVSELPSWAEASRVALDIETCDPDLGDLGPGEHRDGRIIGVSFAIEDSHHAYYLPIGHALDGNMDEHVVLRYLRDQARAFKGVLVGQNLSYDLGYLRKAGVFFSPRRYADVKLAAAILDETLPSYALDAIARNMGIPGKASTGLESAALAYGLTNPKAEMWKLPARHVAPYAIRDVTLPLELMRRQERAILDCDGLDGAWNLECDVFPIMVEMREIGVPVDRAHLDKVEETAILEEQKHLDAIYHATGCRISSDDVNKKTALLPVLRYLGVKPELTETGQKRKDAGDEIRDQDYKVNAALLEGLDSPVGHRLLMAKKANKVRNTFVSSIRRSMTADGKIHCSLNQMKRDADDGSGTKGTVTGRMSATNPNMQQQLSRDKFWGPIWRAVFIPNPGEQWACLDFSCYSEDTEILTNVGWKFFKDLTELDKVAQWEDGVVSFVLPSERQDYDYKGNMVHLKGKVVDQLVTPNHDLVLLNTMGNSPHKVRADSALPRNYRIPSCGVLYGGTDHTPAEARLAVAIQADASDRGKSFRFYLKKTRKIERLQRLLKDLGVKGKTNGPYECKGGQYSISFSKEEVPANVLDLLKPGSREFSFKVKDMDLPAREAFLGELLYWDGSSDGSYFTSDVKNGDLIQEVAAISGRRTTRKVESFPGKKDRCTVGLGKTPRVSTSLRRTSIELVPYSGKVYCVTVPSGMVVVRRNGRVCVSGNSQEPRISAHFALEAGLKGAKDVVDEYNRNPRMDMHQRTADLINMPQIDRKKAKDVFLGLMYLMGEGKLCEMYLDVPTVRSEKKFHGRYYQKAGPEGQRILQKFHEMVPWAKKLGYETKDFADRNGYIQTLSGRRRRFEQKLTGGFDFTYRALNAKVQGTAADQLKYALVALKKAGMVPMLPVHDELDDSIKTVEEARERARIMEQAMPMSVPSVVDVEIGPNWAEIRKIPD